MKFQYKQIAVSKQGHYTFEITPPAGTCATETFNVTLGDAEMDNGKSTMEDDLKTHILREGFLPNVLESLDLIELTEI